MTIPVRPSPLAVTADVDGSPVIKHAKSQVCWKLGRPAFLVWRGIVQRRSLAGIQSSLVHELALTESEAARVVQQVIESLRANELVVDDA